jgi:hypothetical protein
MRRRSFIGAILASPTLGFLPASAGRDFSMWTNYPVEITVPIEKIVSSVIENITFELNPIHIDTFGEVSLYEDINEEPQIDITINYEDGSSRDFISKKKKWTYLVDAPSKASCVIEGNEILTCGQYNDKWYLCTYSDVKEVFDET